MRCGILALVVLVLGPVVSRAEQAGRPPNVIVILADDLGYGDLGVQGGKDIPTPHIDSIAKNGVRFTNGYVSGPYCSPTRAGLLTGRYQKRFGHEFNEGGADRDKFGLPLTETTIADRLKALGYATCAVGKWHLGGGRRVPPDEARLRRVLRHARQHAVLPPDELRRFAQSRRRARRSRTRPSTPPTPTPSGPSTGSSKHKDKPFFLYLPFNARHVPSQAPEKYLDRFPNIDDKRAPAASRP